MVRWLDFNLPRALVPSYFKTGVFFLSNCLTKLWLKKSRFTPNNSVYLFNLNDIEWKESQMSWFILFWKFHLHGKWCSDGRVIDFVMAVIIKTSWRFHNSIYTTFVVQTQFLSVQIWLDTLKAWQHTYFCWVSYSSSFRVKEARKNGVFNLGKRALSMFGVKEKGRKGMFFFQDVV